MAPTMGKPTERLKSLRHYLGMHADLVSRNGRPDYFPGIPGLLLERGEAFTGPGEALTPDEAQTLADAAAAWHGGFAIKECFYNCQRLAVSAEGALRYWEGYAWGGAVIPVHHAWVTINGKVIDLTWRQTVRAAGRVPGEFAYDVLGSFLDRFALGLMPEDAVFLGVEIDTSNATLRMCKYEAWVSYLDDWESNFPLLRRDAWEAA